MAQEEDIPLSGSAKSKPRQDNEAEQEIRMEAHNPDLQNLLGGGSNEEFLRQLIALPEDKLIPWEECTLPSKGIYYNWPDGVVMVKAMGQTAEKVLATQRLAQSGQSIDYLFRECCKFPNGFDPADLLLGDRVFLLYFLRGITHGNLYEFMIGCPNCETSSTHKYDLNDLASTITWADAAVGREPFKVILPYMSKVTNREVFVGVRFLRASDANEILSQRKFRKQAYTKPGNSVRSGGLLPSQRNKQKIDNNTLDESITENLEKMITSVMGITDQIAIRSFVQKLHSTDTSTIREWVREHSPGIDTTVIITCQQCDHEFKAELPISESFFRPVKA